MKKECDIVKDLLFSYNDGVLSNTSKQFVEEHLKVCINCKKNLEEIKKDSERKSQEKEIDFLKSVKKKINKQNIIIAISLIILFVIIGFNVLVYNNYNEIASTMEIYLENDITNEQLESIKNKLIEESDNIEIEYISKEKALEKIRNQLGDNSDLLSGYNKDNPINASIEIKTNTEVEKLVEKVQHMPGINHINIHTNENPYILFISKILSN